MKNKKIWMRLYILIFLLVFIVILRSVFHQDHIFSTNTKNGTKTSIYPKNLSRIEILISSIANVSAMEPLVEVSDKCQPAELTPIEKLNCSQHPGLSGRTWIFLDLLVICKSKVFLIVCVFVGNLLEKPRQIILLIKFGFDVDTLEIALREQENLVDKIFLVESTKTHKGVKIIRFKCNFS